VIEEMTVVVVDKVVANAETAVKDNINTSTYSSKKYKANNKQ
jgi:hypothetical protein